MVCNVYINNLAKPWLEPVLGSWDTDLINFKICLYFNNYDTTKKQRTCINCFLRRVDQPEMWPLVGYFRCHHKSHEISHDLLTHDIKTHDICDVTSRGHITNHMRFHMIYQYMLHQHITRLLGLSFIYYRFDQQFMPSSWKSSPAICDWLISLSF